MRALADDGVVLQFELVLIVAVDAHAVAAAGECSLNDDGRIGVLRGLAVAVAACTGSASR